MSIPILEARGKFTSYIRTGGVWTHGTCGAPRDPDRCRWPQYPCPHFIWGHYDGGTREPGRFTSKLAPASSDPLATALRRDRLAFPEYPAPCYNTSAEVTKRCQEAGGGTYLPVRGEEAGVKFVKALRALGPGWGRPMMLSNVETPWGERPWRAPVPAATAKPARKARRPRTVAA